MMVGTLKHYVIELRRRPVLALALSVLLSASCASTARAQFDRFAFNSEGPAPSILPGNTARTGADAGAVQAILTDPNSAGTMFVGSVNGGVWRTTNGGQTWAPLTDNQSSLSIGSLAYKVGDTSTIYAGIGITSFQPWNVNGDPTLSRGDRGFSNSATDSNFWFKTKNPDGSPIFTAESAIASTASPKAIPGCRLKEIVTDGNSP